MKTLLSTLILALAGLPLLAQMPQAAPPGGINNMRRPLYSPRPLPNFTPAAPAAVAGGGDDMIPPGTIDFTSADVSQVLDIYAKLVNRTILRGQLPDAKIVLHTQTQLNRTETIEALQAVLALNGISLIPMGDKFLKALPSDQANSAGGEIDHSGSTNLPDLGTYITHITQLKYVKPSLMVPILQPFAKLQNGLQPIDDNGILVMRDYAENIKRMLEMIEQIDVSVPAEYVSEVIPIRYAKVDDIASALNSLGGTGGSTVSIGTAPGSISGVGTRSTSVIGGFGGGGNGVSSGVGGGIGSSGGYQSGIGSGSTFGTRTTGATTPNGTPTTGTTFQQRLNNILNQTAGGSGGGGGGKDQIQLFGQTKIIPNESSSTLLIYATREDMAMIKEIIAKLDVPLAQVLIEAVIMDVTLGNTFALGLSAAQNPQQMSGAAGGIIGGGGINNGQSFANFINNITTVTNGLGQITGTSSSIASALGTNGGAFSSALPGGLSYFANIGPNYDVALTAAESDSHASIIQQPRIQTSQAKPAQFFVGDTVPYVTGNTYGGAYGNSSSYSQLSVGVELDVTPFINPDGEVSMDIQQEIDDLNGYTDITGVGQVPNTIKRTLNTSITVRDRDTVMLGGFIKTDKSTSKSGVPFLSSIPLLGNLFSQRNDSKDREELIVLMRPTVLKTPELAGRNTILESQRLPGISGAAADDAEYEHNLVEAERVRELRAAKNGSNTNGFYNILDQMKDQDTNAVPADGTDNAAPQNNQPDADEPAADPAAAAQAAAQADFQQKVNTQDSAPAAPAISPEQKKQLDAALNDWVAGKITIDQYKAMRAEILAGGL